MPTPKFKKGISGNPKGRPKTKVPINALRTTIADNMPDIITKLVELAKGGDVQAARVLLDRVCPALKPQALPVNLPVMESLAGQDGEIIRATMSGEIPPDIGSQLITALSAQAKIIEIDELARRIEALETKR